MPDPLRTVLAAAEHAQPCLTAAAARWWPGWAVPGLERAGVLAPDVPAQAVECEECGENHVERVEAVDTPGRPRRWFHPCPAVGRAEVRAERLQQWVVRAVAVGRLIGTAEPDERLPGRVWGLGTLSAGGTTRHGWLVVGWRGETGLTDRVPELVQPNAAVFVPATLPPAGVWGRSAPRPVVPLATVLTLTTGGLAVDAVALAAFLGPLDDGTPPAEPTVVTPEPDGDAPAVPLPPGTPWEEVTVEVDDHHVVVSAPAGRWRVGYEKAGFADNRTGAPNTRWALLRLLAKSGGELGTGDDIRTKPDMLTKSVSDLRAVLRALTGLKSNPFHPTPRGESYRTRFRIRATTARPEAE